MSKEAKIGIFLFLIVSVLISFAFFAESISVSQDFSKENKKLIKEVQYKIDSLEKVINTSFKDKKDTLIIKVVPQEVKVFYNKETK